MLVVSDLFGFRVVLFMVALKIFVLYSLRNDVSVVYWVLGGVCLLWRRLPGLDMI